MIDLYKQYLIEREDKHLVSLEGGFATYKQVDQNSVWLVDIFVVKELRRNGVATKLSEMVAEKAKELGCNTLIGSVDITANGVTQSMQAILSDGFKFSHGQGNMLFFTKALK